MWLFESLFPNYVWKVKTNKKIIYLTFDDGPIPEITPWVLDLLDHYEAKGTFFCVGENISKNPGVFNSILSQGHSVGNHTYNHVNGWKTPNETYLGNFKKSERVHKTKLFRPPYGRIKKKAAEQILDTHQIIMWSVLTKDYSQTTSPEKCLERAIKQTKSGSIVLFHDSLKAEKNLRYALPKFLEYFSKKGYTFEALPN